MISLLSFRLPRSTPPGSYQGNIELGGEPIPIVVDVDPRCSLRFIHPKLACRGAPGARVSARLTLWNRGNVSVTVPDQDTFCVFDEAGLSRAFYQGMVEQGVGGQARIDRIMNELAKAHGGLVKVKVAKGSGPLPPDEVRELEADLHFSRRLIARHTYRGTWSVSSASLDVQMEAVTGGAAGRGENA